MVSGWSSWIGCKTSLAITRPSLLRCLSSNMIERKLSKHPGNRLVPLQPLGEEIPSFSGSPQGAGVVIETFKNALEQQKFVLDEIKSLIKEHDINSQSNSFVAQLSQGGKLLGQHHEGRQSCDSVARQQRPHEQRLHSIHDDQHVQRP